MQHWRAAGLLACWLSLVSIPPSALAVGTNQPPADALTTQINVAGTFNDWNPTNAAYRMTQVGDRELRLETFFKAGRYKFKFAFDGSWAKNWGTGPGGILVQSGSDIPLKINKHGAYRIGLNLQERRWTTQEVPVDAPHAVINVLPSTGSGQAVSVEVGIPITLDASESVAR